MNKLEVLAEFERVALDAPLGQAGAELLDQLERVLKLCTELKDYYKRQLSQDPRCIPGWALKPGVIRRSLGDPQACWEKVSDLLSSKAFMSAVKVEIGKLQEIWATAARVPSAQAKEAFNKLMADQLITFQNAPSLTRIK